MATASYDRGRCLRYKSDLQPKVSIPSPPPVTSPPPVASPPPVTSPPVVESGHSSLFVWTFLSLVALLIYIIFRRQEDKSHQDENEQLKETTNEKQIHHQESTEYRLSAVRALPTITEENFNSLTPSNSQPTFSTNVKRTSSLDQVSDNPDRDHSSLLLKCQAEIEQNNGEDLDGFVRIPQLKNDSSATSLIVDETGHPIIFRKFCSPHENAIKDEFVSLDEVNRAVEEVGLVRSQLIFGIDYTISNLETGKHSFNGLSLHHIEEGLLNPYQSVITIIGRTLENFDSDSLIPAFGFGDRTTLDRKIFPLYPDGSYCRGFRGVLQAYNKITPKVRMSGPTNFGPLIKEAIRIVKKTGQYHILVIVADGQVTNERQTKEAIVEASHYPLSIVMIGVGDGPWDMMEEFDDSLPARQFDNFQFVNYNSIVQASLDTDADFALHALMEIPSQYATIKNLGLLKNT